MMKIAFAVLLILHGLIHLLGFAKGFQLAAVEALKEPITKAQGAGWLLAAVLFVVAAIGWVWFPRWWWVAGVPAVIVSQVLIVAAWSDARFGTVANVLVFVPLVLGMLDLRPQSPRSRYARAVAEERAAALASPSSGPVSEADLAALPPPVQAWLRRAGVVGKPHVRGFHAVFTGTFRNGADAPWMEFTADQHSFFAPRSRSFLMTASMKGVPFDALHLYRGAHATMDVRVLGLVQMVDARGEIMDHSETVTLFNDLVVLAPGAVVDAGIVWESIDDARVRARFTNAGQTVTAVLTFDADHDLVGFVSDDRSQTADGKTYRRLPWSTPLSEHTDYGGVRLPRLGEATWLQPEGDLTYGRFVLESLTLY